MIASCSSKATHELVVDVNVSEVLVNEARNSRSSDFKRIYDATIEARKKSKGDVFQLFFKNAKELYPNTPFIRYFRSNSELSMGASNEEVIEYFNTQKEICLEKVKVILSVRLDDFGVSYAKVVHDQVKIGLSSPGKDSQMRKIVQMQGNLQFFEVYRTEEIMSSWLQAVNISDPENDGRYGSLKKVKPYGGFFFVSFAQKNEVDRTLNKDVISDVLPANLSLMWGDEIVIYQGTKEKGYILYPCKIPLNGKAIVNDSDIKDANSGFNEMDGKSTVDLVMTTDGSDKWKKMTAENVGRTIAITVSDIVFSAPTVINPIMGGTTQISGSFTPEEAEQLASILSVGSLPVSCLFNEMVKL